MLWHLAGCEHIFPGNTYSRAGLPQVYPADQVRSFNDMRDVCVAHCLHSLTVTVYMVFQGISMFVAQHFCRYDI